MALLFIMIIDFNDISENSKLWVYGSDKQLNIQQKQFILKIIEGYLKNWKHHKHPLTSAITILENRFIVIALDDSEYGIGGCSIDSLQKIIQKIENEFNISLLNRLNVFCKIDDEIQCVTTLN